MFFSFSRKLENRSFEKMAFFGINPKKKLFSINRGNFQQKQNEKQKRG